ncbi:type II toxin-antitoxin system Phd/YefM family antitoxin [Tardiphaga alba]|uniref:Type II toxin-antitoxin system Phd/YefM family antitoxin n=1 Tax=Tardiphaga alba TaxID=340268 RepID=A0ABX8AAA3_9BRAD|nr:type II toxin-antitoxin system Phd/YefM family antitoxin [Tardiphaga alba]QUS39240.1 type II toxin-antitoxin system Phd/YefM family antitoxin [Tardiphaga alba]
MTKHVAISGEDSQLAQMVAEMETTGDEVIITRDGVAVARLVPEQRSVVNGELTPEQIEKRKQAIANLQKMARELKVGATHDEIKGWINEGRR